MQEAPEAFLGLRGSRFPNISPGALFGQARRQVIQVIQRELLAWLTLRCSSSGSDASVPAAFPDRDIGLADPPWVCADHGECPHHPGLLLLPVPSVERFVSLVGG
jgi:hypothetical protein